MELYGSDVDTAQLREFQGNPEPRRFNKPGQGCSTGPGEPRQWAGHHQEQPLRPKESSVFLSDDSPVGEGAGPHSQPPPRV